MAMKSTDETVINPLVAQGTTGKRGSRLRLGLRHIRSALVTRRIWLLVLAHLILFTAAYWGAFLLRFEFAIPPNWQVVFFASLPWVLGIKLCWFWITGQLHGWWRYVTFGDLVSLARACLICFLTIVVINHFMVSAGYRIPRAVLILDSILCLGVIGSLRSTWRLFQECVWPAMNADGYRSAILVGADDESVFLAHQIQSYGRAPYRVHGLLRTNGSDRRGRLGRIPILGHVNEIGQVAAAHGITDVLITAGRMPGKELRDLMDVCEHQGLQLKIIPRFEDRLRGDRFLPVRDVNIEDLLRRESADLDTEAIEKLIQGKTVLVTGAGGSIGSEICRQLIHFRPKCLVLLGRGENRIFAIQRELSKIVSADSRLEVAIADVRDHARVMQLMEQYRPVVVFHAAAHKHVPLMEANVGEAVKNNVLGTKCIADASHYFGVQNFVLVSTDKSVRPSSVMGATKQMAERYVHALSNESSTRFVAVRFGNVLGSAGSVVPVFQEQIRAGGPISITDPCMERYFMTIPEASQLVLQAASMGRGGEVYLLEMGSPVKIVDLARDLIRLSGLPEDAIEIIFTGARPGEKLNEELSHDAEQTLETAHRKLFAVYQSAPPLSDVQHEIAELAKLIDVDSAALYDKLREVVQFHDAECDIEASPVCSNPSLSS